MLEVTSVAQETAHGVNFAEVYKNSEIYRQERDLNYENGIFDFNNGEYLAKNYEALLVFLMMLYFVLTLHIVQFCCALVQTYFAIY